jgi:hypothetical protein
VELRHGGVGGAELQNWKWSSPKQAPGPRGSTLGILNSCTAKIFYMTRAKKKESKVFSVYSLDGSASVLKIWSPFYCVIIVTC